ncbi:hypothetical protein VP275E431_P0054 [Vibrio phage 275E43-1]|nr:hypothetical protein VP275E431_P0054 [Vibrio phage 275E43-1]
MSRHMYAVCAPHCEKCKTEWTYDSVSDAVHTWKTIYKFICKSCVEKAL